MPDITAFVIEPLILDTQYGGVFMKYSYEYEKQCVELYR